MRISLEQIHEQYQIDKKEFEGLAEDFQLLLNAQVEILRTSRYREIESKDAFESHKVMA
jgi:hypothetical protein